MKYTCPLEFIQSDGFSRSFYVKRMDLLSNGGGNKVPRFDEFFRTHGHVKKLVAFSNPGSHTFEILQSYMTGSVDDFSARGVSGAGS